MCACAFNVKLHGSLTNSVLRVGDVMSRLPRIRMTQKHVQHCMTLCVHVCVGVNRTHRNYTCYVNMSAHMKNNDVYPTRCVRVERALLRRAIKYARASYLDLHFVIV